MLQSAHIFLMSLYIVLPPIVLIASFAAARRRGIPAAHIWPKLTVAVATSLLLGIAASMIYGLWLGGIVPPVRMALACYWAAGLICILKGLDFLLDCLARLVFATGAGSWKRRQRRSAAQIFRVFSLFIIGLPYMIAAAATYCPNTILKNESAWFDAGATRVSFESTDGLLIAGFWTAAPAPSLGDIPNPHWGRKTLVICPGSRAGKSSYLDLASRFLNDGYNVLTFDFRGHGQSGGQIVTFGDHERRDVLGAVRWLRRNHPMESRRIVAIGVDTGAAALLAAAADPSNQGRALDALAVFGCYDRFDKFAADAARVSFPPPLQWLIVPVAVPLACVQTGADLRDFSPANAAAAVSPRPILFIAGEGKPFAGQRDSVITFDRGQSLFDAANAPKSHLWIEDLTDDQATGDPRVVNRALRFLNTAVPML
ncbi:MAG: alpha/beta hydrolase [Tepidisphaeraceae bacterium]